MSQITGAQAAALILGVAEQAIASEVKSELAKELPIFIKYLQNCEKTHPGFLGILKDIDMALVDVAELALGWVVSNP